MSRKIYKSLSSLFGVEFSPVSHAERLISAMGGFLGILGVIWISHYFVATEGAALIVASMGASAVLLFAIPHGPLSQPWPLVGGNVISAIIGVSCAKLFPGSFVTAAVASARGDFARWARYEVAFEDGAWRRVQDQDRQALADQVPTVSKSTQRLTKSA